MVGNYVCFYRHIHARTPSSSSLSLALLPGTIFLRLSSNHNSRQCKMFQLPYRHPPMFICFKILHARSCSLNDKLGLSRFGAKIHEPSLHTFFGHMVTTTKSSVHALCMVGWMGITLGMQLSTLSPDLSMTVAMSLTIVARQNKWIHATHTCPRITMGSRS
jgi:hypothetical protein